MLPLDDEEYALEGGEEDGQYDYPTANRKYDENMNNNNSDYFFFLDGENEVNAVSVIHPS